MNKRKLLFISQGLSPYLTETPDNIRGRLVPQGLQEKGFEVRTFMPKYGCINERRNQLHEVIRLSGMNLIIDDTDHPLIIKVATLQPSRMQVYFIDNDDYFHHDGSKDLEIHTMPEDNDERLMFFVRGVVETVKKLRWTPEVIHCSGWISSIAPLYLKKIYNDDPALQGAKIVVSLTNPGDMKAPIPKTLVDKMKMEKFSDKDLKPLADAEVIDYDTLVRLAIDYADAVVADHPDVDPSLLDYARSQGKTVMEYDSSKAHEAVDADTIGSFITFYDSLQQ